MPWPYGGFALEPMAANGGWVASAVDLVAFAAALGPQPRRPLLLQSATLAESTQRPAFQSAGNTWYGKGWSVNVAGHRWHTGTLPGTMSLLLAAANGTQWAAVLNLRSESELDAMVLDLDNTLWRVYNAVRNWPAGDQFVALGNPGPIAGCYGRPAYGHGVLCLPVVEVPVGGAAPARYTATMRLADAASLTFALDSALPALGESDTVGRVDPAAGTLTLPAGAPGYGRANSRSGR